MSKRLEVVFPDDEMQAIQAIASSERMTIKEWVRMTLRTACHSATTASATNKINSIRAAVRYEFPIANMSQTLAEIDQGYTASDSP